MAIVHDVAEALVGDITPHCNVSKEEKQRLEEGAIAQIKQMLGPSTASGETKCRPAAATAMGRHAPHNT